MAILGHSEHLLEKYFQEKVDWIYKLIICQFYIFGRKRILNTEIKTEIIIVIWELSIIFNEKNNDIFTTENMFVRELLFLKFNYGGVVERESD